MTPYGKMDPSSTHQPLLAAVICHTTGPVVEFGVGNYSTPFLHWLCQERTLYSLESNPDWFNAFSHYQTESHKMICGDYGSIVLPDIEWDVAFIDHAPAARRVVDIERMLPKARYIVCHDTEDPAYGYEPVFARCNVLTMKCYPVRTSVISIKEDLQWLTSSGIPRLS